MSYNYAWYCGDSGGSTKEVGQKTANALGLKDMSGNVREWCYDWYEGYDNASQSDPVGPGSGSLRVFRGGSWHDYSLALEVGNRDDLSPSDRHDYLGFRLCRTAD